MGSACSKESRAISPNNQPIVKSKLIRNGNESVGITSDNIVKNKSEMYSIHNPCKLFEQDTADVNKTGEVNEQRDGADDDELEKEADGDENEADEDESEEGKKKKREPFTEEELNAFKEKKFSELRNTAQEVFALKSLQNEDGEYVKTVRNACIRFYNSYFALKRATMDKIVKYRHECAKIMIETKFADLACDIIIFTYTTGWYNADGKKNDHKFAPLLKCLITVQNYTDSSDDLAIYLSNLKRFPEMMIQVLSGYADRRFGKVEPQLKQTEERVLSIVISISHNLAMRESNIGPLREHGFVQALQPYLESSKAMHRLNTLSALADIINEEECEIINANKSSVAFLLKVLGHCLKDKKRRHNGWSAKETGMAVRSLARNDANKKLLVELGALELLVEMGQTGNTEEQYESVSAIWALCFDKDNRVYVTSKPELQVIELLLDLKQTNDTAIKKVCNGALWTLRDDLRNSTVEKYKTLGEKLHLKQEEHKHELERAEPSKKKKKSDKIGHVMISYQWGHQEILKEIRDRLKDQGFKIWMDIDQMGGSTLQAMADAVECADIFLMCMSNKYKNSPACRAEAEYAFQTRKKIIPLRMEPGYCADGWLGFILGAKLFFDFSGKYPFEDKMNGLIKELKSALTHVQTKQGSDGSHFTPTAPAPAFATQVQTTTAKPSRTTSAPRQSLSSVRNWDTDDVKKWIETKNLKSSGLDGMTGSEIAYLAKMQTDAPEFFHKFIYDTLKAKSVTTISKIGWALHDLSEDF